MLLGYVDLDFGIIGERFPRVEDQSWWRLVEGRSNALRGHCCPFQ
jgi:hypothetical protein